MSDEQPQITAHRLTARVSAELIECPWCCRPGWSVGGVSVVQHQDPADEETCPLQVWWREASEALAATYDARSFMVRTMSDPPPREAPPWDDLMAGLVTAAPAEPIAVATGRGILDGLREALQEVEAARATYRPLPLYFYRESSRHAYRLWLDEQNAELRDRQLREAIRRASLGGAP